MICRSAWFGVKRRSYFRAGRESRQMRLMHSLSDYPGKRFVFGGNREKSRVENRKNQMM